MNKTDTISIVVATDNHYSILLGALIKSIEINHKTDEKIDIYIINDGISENNIKKIKTLINPEMISLFWFKTSQVVPEDIKIPRDKSAFPITSYLRLFAPYIIPQHLKKFIYLDVDMIVVEDISKLWAVDLKDNLFGAVQDLAKIVSSDWGGIPNYKELGFDPATKYFNAGLLVVDPVKWREEDISKKVFQCINENISFVNLADQYGLNVVLVNRWTILDERWNSYSALEIEDPYIIHFLDIKPIFKSYRSNKKYYEEFHKYLNLTPWANQKPISDYVRLGIKVYNKARKIILSHL